MPWPCPLELSTSQLGSARFPALQSPVASQIPLGRGIGKGGKQPVSISAVPSEKKKEPCLPSRGWESSELSRLALCLASPSSDIWEQYVVSTAPRSLDSEEWSRWGRRGWQDLRLGQLGSLNTQQQEPRSPQARRQPQDAPPRALSLRGHRAPQAAPKDARRGQQEPESRVALP